MSFLNSVTKVLSAPFQLQSEISTYLYRRYFPGQQLSLVNKIVLVTGASSGIGQDLAIKFFFEGAQVIVAARSTDKLEKLSEEMSRISDSLTTDIKYFTPKILTLDLGDPESVEKAVETVRGLFGRVDVLVNCGGISVRGGAIETDLNVYRRLMEVNFFGTIDFTKRIVEMMKNNNEGMVVMISSIQGKMGIPNRAAYGASKHAIQAFSDSLRAEVAAFGVDVLVVSPGYVKTNLSMNALTAHGEAYATQDETTLRGYDVDYVSAQVIKSIKRRDKELVLCSLVHRLAIMIRCLLPFLFFYIMRGRAESERQAEQRRKIAALEKSKGE